MKNIHEIAFGTFMILFTAATSTIKPAVNTSAFDRIPSGMARRAPAVVVPTINRAPANLAVVPKFTACTTDIDCELKNPRAELLNLMDEIAVARIKGCEQEARELVRQGIGPNFQDVETEGYAYAAMIDCTLDQAE
jgi:hypothetical protein